MNTVRAAAVQMVSGSDVQTNLAEADRWVREAAARGAHFVVLPENFAIMGEQETDKLKIAEKEGIGPIQDFLAESAERYKIWIAGGTIPIISGTLNKVRTACLVYDDTGKRVGRYDKIHLFDVSIPGSKESYQESSTIEAGQKIVVITTPFGRIGVTICYDLRFPELYRQMSCMGVDFFIVPSAFTARTGMPHWEVLLRARAIENLCYVIGANQGGVHSNGRETYGHSMIIDPWGSVLDTLQYGPGVAIAECNGTYLESVRTTFPVLQHVALRSNTVFL